MFLDGNSVPNDGEIKQWLSSGSHLLELRGSWRACSVRLQVLAESSTDPICAAVEDHYITDAVPCYAIGQLVVPKVTPDLGVASNNLIPSNGSTTPKSPAPRQRPGPPAGDLENKTPAQGTTVETAEEPAVKPSQAYQPRTQGKVIGRTGSYVDIDLGERDNLKKDMIIEAYVATPPRGRKAWCNYTVFRVFEDKSRLELQDKRLGNAQPGDPVRIPQSTP